MPLDDGSDLYDDPELYDLEHAGYRGDVAWYLGQCQRAGARRVLELGCGTGRLLIPLARAGLEVVGIDASAALIGRCRERLARLDTETRARARCEVADLRTRTRREPPFELAAAAFNTLQHVDAAGLGAWVAALRRVLDPGGHLAFDLYAPARELATGQPVEDTQVAIDADGQTWTIVRWRRLHADGWLESRYRVAGDGARPPRLLRQFQWSRDALATALDRHGLHLVDEAGDLDGRAWTPGAPRWLARWRLAAQPG